jgi:NTP pyrophosphatase (non-canonical NTP hydrolase)
MNVLDKLRVANQERHKIWPGAGESTMEFSAIEFGGEAGEVLDAVKKYIRTRDGIAGNKAGTNLDMLKMAIMEEMGDVLISMDLLARDLDINLTDCVPMKFNKTSAKVGIKCFMDPITWDTSEYFAVKAAT